MSPSGHCSCFMFGINPVQVSLDELAILFEACRRVPQSLLSNVLIVI
jgi:hypothetical protein